MKIHKIAIVGAESSGKSTLTHQIADVFKCSFVDEYAREYIDDLTRAYSYNDLVIIAKRQKERENKAYLQANKILVCDSSMLTIKIWSIDKFGRCDQWVEEESKHEKFDLVLLCKPDLVWQKDPQREDEKRRDIIYSKYLDQLTKSNFSFKVVEGQGDQRLDLAIKHINQLLYR